MGRLQLLRYCKFRKSPEQRSNGEMIKKKKKKKVHRALLQQLFTASELLMYLYLWMVA